MGDADDSDDDGSTLDKSVLTSSPDVGSVRYASEVQERAVAAENGEPDVDEHSLNGNAPTHVSELEHSSGTPGKAALPEHGEGTAAVPLPISTAPSMIRVRIQPLDQNSRTNYDLRSY